MFYFLKALKIFSTVAEWSGRALEDEKVSVFEAANLISQLCSILEIEAEIDFSKIDIEKMQRDQLLRRPDADFDAD